MQHGILPRIQAPTSPQEGLTSGLRAAWCCQVTWDAICSAAYAKPTFRQPFLVYGGHSLLGGAGRAGGSDR